MTAEQQIEKQIDDELTKFYNEVYTGSVAIPNGIIDDFKKCLMQLPPNYHKIQGLRIKGIVDKGVKKLSNGDLSEVVKVIINTPLNVRFNSYEEAIKSVILQEKFILAYNQHVEDFRKKLQMKKTTLRSLAPSRNGARIIPTA